MTAKTAPVKKPGKKGMPEFEPTVADRLVVEQCAGYRMPQDEIAKLIINPRTGKHINESTLKEKFRDELDTGYAKLKMSVHAAKIKHALEGNATLIIWTEKTLFGAKELIDVSPPMPVDIEDDDKLQAARRVAFMLSFGAIQAGKVPRAQAIVDGSGKEKKK